MRKLTALLTALALTLGLVIPAAAENTPKSEDIVILYTNDIHSYIDKELSYDTLAALKNEMEKQYEHVLLVDAGDHVQGTACGAMDKGKSIVEIMNAAGYDLAAPGNHEFDYGMDGLMNIVDWAEYPYLACNFYHESNGVRGETVLDRYALFDCGEQQIAFVGITAPDYTTPTHYQDGDGNMIYGISGTSDAASLQADVQQAIDDATAAGADIVIALGHLGVDLTSGDVTSEKTIAAVSGLDAFIDGHSHTVMAGELIPDKNGENVLLTQAGEYFSNIGQMVIDAETGEITTELLSVDDLADITPDPDVQSIKDGWINEINTTLGEVIGRLDVTLDNYDADGNRLVRSRETNTGDFCSDALYYLFDNMGLDVDVAVSNGGGIRNYALTGDITYLDCKTIHPFGNIACLQTVTGQQLLDMLEWSAREAGPGMEIGGFLHVSGIKLEIDVTIPSTVQTVDGAGEVWAGPPTGEYRVRNVQIYDKDTCNWKALDLEAHYNLAGYNYILRNQGNGYTMFNDSVNVVDYVMEDYMVLANYISAFENGVVEASNSPISDTHPGFDINYSSVYGDDRITIYLPHEGKCVDRDDNHHCDTCNAELSRCTDEDGNHCCDVCWENMPELCVDEDGDHTCEDCESQMDWLCQDLDKDHRCDNPDCAEHLSYCKNCDDNKDQICDLCGKKIYPGFWLLSVDAEAGDGQITVTWNELPAMVADDPLANYTIYCYEEENQDHDAADQVTFTPDDCPFTYTFTGLTNDVPYEIELIASYTLVAGDESSPYSINDFAYATPVSASASVPGTPEIVGFSCEDGAITIKWTDPADNGGSKIHGYCVELEQGAGNMIISVDSDSVGDGEVKSYTVDELTNGTDYRIGVCAINGVGEGETAWTDAPLPLFPYKLIVGGVQVSEENMADVLGDGTVSYDPEHHVLTLNNANIAVTEGNYGIDSGCNLTIELVGENNLSCTGYYGLLGRKNLTIQGEGTLNVAGSDFGIEALAELTVCGSAVVNAVSGDVASGRSFGIRSADTLIVCENAIVSSTGGKAPATSYGIYAGANFVVCDDAQVNAYGGEGTESSIGIYIYDPFEIYGNAVVTACADESEGRSCGTYPLESLYLMDDAVLNTTGTRAGNDSYGMRTTDIFMEGGTLIATGGEGVYDSLGIHAQNFHLTDGSATLTAGSASSGPSLGLRVTKHLTINGGNLTALGGDAPADASCGIYAGEGMYVENGSVKAVSGTAADYTHGIETDCLIVENGEITAQAAAASAEDSFSWGIQAYNELTISGGTITAIAGEADGFSYGAQTSGIAAISGGKLTASAAAARKSFGLWAFDAINLSNCTLSLRSQGNGIYSYVGLTLGDTLSINHPYSGQIIGDEETPWTITDLSGTAAANVEIGVPQSSGDSSGSSSSSNRPNPKPEPKPELSEAYTDLDAEAWYHEAVEYVLEKGLMTGVSKDSFAPGMQMTRGMIVTILWSMAGKPDVNAAVDFSDVKDGQWYTDAVRWAVSEGIAAGYGDGAFGISDPLTREQLATILYSYEKKQGGGFTGMWMFLLKHPDAMEIADWAYEPMCWMTMKGVISGKDNGMLDPKGTAVRAEAAQMLMQFLELHR